MIKKCMDIFALDLFILWQGKSLTDFTNLFSLKNVKNNDKVILNHIFN